VVVLNEGQRNIPVSYAKRTRGDRVFAGVDTHLPLRVITAGVIPIIFALAFLSIPGLLGQILTSAKTHWVSQFASNLTTWFSPNGMIYAVSYFVLVVAFTYFYTSVVFNPKDIAENLQKQGGFIPGIRPGNQTATYLKRVVNRITLAGALGLGFIAVLPFIGQAFTNSQILTFGWHRPPHRRLRGHRDPQAARGSGRHHFIRAILELCPKFGQICILTTVIRTG